MKKTKQKPKKRVYAVESILQAKTAMRDTLLQDFCQDLLVGECYNDFVDRVLELLPGKHRREIVYDSLAYLIGEEATKEALDVACWRLIANKERLKSRVVGPWVRQSIDEWVPAQIIDARRHKLGRKVGYMFSLKVLAGLAASMKIEKFWSGRFCFFLGGQTLGFSKPRGVRPMQDPREFVSLRLLLLIEREHSSNRPGFDSVDINPSLLDWNRSIMDSRNIVKRTCPKNYDCQCYLCPIGSKDCAWSVHANTYIFAECDHCREPDAPFDPVVSLQLCVNCMERRALQGDD